MPSPSSPDQLLRAAVERGEVPGVVALAANRTGVIYEGAFGLAESGARRAMTADAIFDIASMTKAVTSVVAMQLIEKRRLSLDDEAAKYLPELARPMVLESFDPATGAHRLRPAASPITVRQLFTHTSGLGYAFTSERLNLLRSRHADLGVTDPLLFDPGTQWLYGTSTDRLGEIVATLAGRDLETLFRERIFGPLAMHDTFYNIPVGKHTRAVNLHRRLGDGTVAELPRPSPQTRTTFRGGGGLHSTAADYLRFLRMLLNGGELDGVRLLSPKTVELMHANHVGDKYRRDVSAFGLGFWVNNDPGYYGELSSEGAYGWGSAYYPQYFIDPKERLVSFFLTQLMPAGTVDVNQKFKVLTYQAIVK